MDPVSLSATAITIGSAGLSAARGAKKLYRAVNQAKTFAEVIERIARGLRAFATTIRLTKMSIVSVRNKHPDSAVARWIVDQGLAHTLKLISVDVEEQIDVFTERFQRVAETRGMWSFSRKLWWTLFHREDVEVLNPQLQILSTYFSTVLQSLQIEVLLAQGETPETREEM